MTTGAGRGWRLRRSTSPEPRPRAKAGAAITAHLAHPDALLLDRRTYDNFAAYWPQAPSDTPLAERFNTMPKLGTRSKPAEPRDAGEGAISGIGVPGGLPS